jgi:hypothetical protein
LVGTAGGEEVRWADEVLASEGVPLDSNRYDRPRNPNFNSGSAPSLFVAPPIFWSQDKIN